MANYEDITIVLFGSTGCGKSATGNSILGRKAFQSKALFGGVTKTCNREATKLDDGRILNVIDTPGLFGPSSNPQDVQKEIVRCIEMGRDGIHAVLIVVSLNVRFSKEQAAAVETLKHLFGPKIVDYMIVAFTGADELEEDETLDDRLSSSPQALKDLLNKCGNRRIVFDNKTKDAAKKAQQLHQLLTLTTNIVEKNGGKPYTYQLFEQLKNEAVEKGNGSSKQQMNDEKKIPLLIPEKNEAVEKGIENSKQHMYDEKQIQQINAEKVVEKEKEQSNDDESYKKLKEGLEKVAKELIDRKREEAKNEIEIRKLRQQLSLMEQHLTSHSQPRRTSIQLPPCQML